MIWMLIFIQLIILINLKQIIDNLLMIQTHIIIIIIVVIPAIVI